MNKEEIIDSQSTIHAAGAILWRGEPYYSDIVVIHRSRHGDEWCLPKGKTEVRETLENTALREVKEETGCDVQIISFADIQSYRVNGRKKYVFYWHMKLTGSDKLTLSDETDQIVWLPVQEAIKLLSHRGQRKLLYKQLNKNRLPLIIRAPHLFKSLRYTRLQGALESYRAEIQARIQDSKKNKRYWLNKASDLLDNSKRALENKNIDIAWKCFHAAQRMEILGMKEHELKIKAKSLKHEAEKLGDWRKKATEDLLGNKCIQTDDGIDKEAVYQAALIRDEHFNNIAYKGNLFRYYISTLLILLISASLLITLYFILFNFDDLNNGQNHIFIGVILFGLLGAAFSTILKIPSKQYSTRIPEQVYTFRLSLMRVLIGSVSAIFIYILIQTDLVTHIFNIDGIAITPSLLFVVSFVAGFSERLVLKSISRIVK